MLRRHAQAVRDGTAQLAFRRGAFLLTYSRGACLQAYASSNGRWTDTKQLKVLEIQVLRRRHVYCRTVGQRARRPGSLHAAAGSNSG